MLTLPVTKDEFEEAITAIDNDLRARDIEVHSRSLHAVMTYAKLYGVDIPIPSGSNLGSPGIYIGESLGAHIMHWYSMRYGERQYFYMGPGSVIIMLRGDPWEIRLPLILGEVNCVIDRDLKKYIDSPKVTQDGVHPTVNILESVLDLPEGLAKSLSDAECQSIEDGFWMGMECMQAIDRIRDSPYIPEALSDIASAVRHVFSVPSHFGQSKWSSAQAAEKMLKSFLKSRECAFPFTHNIHQLYALCSANGMAALDENTINALQTKASVRYGGESVSLSEAVGGHLASLALGRTVAESMSKKKKPIVDLVKGVNVGADRRGHIVVAKFDLGNQKKTFLIPSSTVKYILSNAKVALADYSEITVPEIHPRDWDGAVSPMWVSLTVDNFEDLVAVSISLNRGTTDGLAFQPHVWSFFINALRQYEKFLIT
jgi:hypothetical protein